MEKENILLLHGALGSKEQLKSLKDLLALGFNVHDLNFEGHGNRSSDAPYSIDLFAKNVIDYLAENNLANTNIFGYSMGGYVALKLASKHPNLVTKIITLGTKFDWNHESSTKEVKMLNPSKIVEKVPAFANLLNSVHTATSWKTVMTKTAEMMLDMGNGNKLTSEDFTSIPHPVLIGIGELDNMVTFEESKLTSALLANGKLEIFEGFKHPFDRIDVRVLANRIVSFIDGEST